MDRVKEPSWIRWTLVSLSFLFMVLILGLPLFVVFQQAFSGGIRLFLDSFQDRETLSAIRLTALVTAVVVIFNTLFGVSAAWLLTRRFLKWKPFIKAVISLPFSISPVIAGLLFVLWFGRSGFVGAWTSSLGIQIIYAVPGIILGTLFVTLPLVFHELVPLMESQGGQEEMAAESLGANHLQTFFWVTLPNIKWALLYGVVLCTARALGEFGAVSVLSGHIQGKTTTLTLQIETLYNGYKFEAAFACATLLSFVAILTLLVKRFVDRKGAKT